MNSSYRTEDVTLLLKDITGQVEPMSTQERENRFKQGYPIAKCSQENMYPARIIWRPISRHCAMKPTVQLRQSVPVQSVFIRIRETKLFWYRWHERVCRLVFCSSGICADDMA